MPCSSSLSLSVFHRCSIRGLIGILTVAIIHSCLLSLSVFHRCSIHGLIGILTVAIIHSCLPSLSVFHRCSIRGQNRVFFAALTSSLAPGIVRVHQRPFVADSASTPCPSLASSPSAAHCAFPGTVTPPLTPDGLRMALCRDKIGLKLAARRDVRKGRLEAGRDLARPGSNLFENAPGAGNPIPA
jgi:hypothetical protein